jgi:hypothetical protein
MIPKAEAGTDAIKKVSSSSRSSSMVNNLTPSSSSFSSFSRTVSRSEVPEYPERTLSLPCLMQSTRKVRTRRSAARSLGETRRCSWKVRAGVGEVAGVACEERRIILEFRFACKAARGPYREQNLSCRRNVVRSIRERAVRKPAFALNLHEGSRKEVVAPPKGDGGDDVGGKGVEVARDVEAMAAVNGSRTIKRGAEGLLDFPELKKELGVVDDVGSDRLEGLLGDIRLAKMA